MNDMNQSNSGNENKKKSHLTLVVDNTQKGKLADKWVEDGANKRREMEQIKNTNTSVFADIQKSMKRIDVNIDDYSNNQEQGSIKSRVQHILEGFRNLLNTIKNHK